MQGTQEHGDMARDTASVLGMGVGGKKKRLGLELGCKRKGEDTLAASSLPPGSTSSPGSPQVPGLPEVPSLSALLLFVYC